MASAALLVFLSQTHSVPSLIVCFTVVGIGAAYLPTFWAIPTEILSKSSAATAVGLINAIGSISGFAGPYSFGYLYTRSGSFSGGLAAMMLAAFAAGLLVLLVPDRHRVSITDAKPIGALLPGPTRSPDAVEVGGIE